MDKQPDSYLHKALESAGFEVTSLTVESYSPEAFGNLVALADTSLGTLRIVYDRGFDVDEVTGKRPLALPLEARKQLLDALASAKRDSTEFVSR